MRSQKEIQLMLCIVQWCGTLASFLRIDDGFLIEYEI